MQKPILVFKIGTSSITNEQGNLDELVVQSVAKQLAALHKEYHIVMVSSGAVGTGKKFIRNYTGKIEERKAAAAIGNPILIYKYSEAFAKYKIPIAQSLCERGHFSDREKFLQLRATYEELWKNGIIPIANENDVVSSRELKFSDNDELATLLAVGFGAQLLLIGTSVDGVLDNDGKVIRRIEKFDDKILGLATKEKSAAGLGGMISKLTFSHMATNLGIKVIIFPAREKFDPTISSEILAERIRNTTARAYPDFDSIISYLKTSLGPNDVLITMGAGEQYKIGEALLD